MIYERIITGRKDNKKGLKKTNSRKTANSRRATSSRKKPELNLTNDC